jgi:hypothetical protein
MVTESVSESTYRPNYFPLPPSLIPTERDEVLDNLVGALNTTLAHPDEAVQRFFQAHGLTQKIIVTESQRRLTDNRAWRYCCAHPIESTSAASFVSCVIGAIPFNRGAEPLIDAKACNG